MAKGKAKYPSKRTMNLFYKPDRTTKPATVALYVLFVLTLLLGLSKFLVYDLWIEAEQAEAARDAAQEQLNDVLLQLTDYAEVRERYSRYAETDEERERIDRMQILELLDGAVGSQAKILAIAISENQVQMQLTGVTLAETASIVSALEASPIVASTQVNTASATGGEGSLASVRIQLQKVEEAPAEAEETTDGAEEESPEAAKSTLGQLVDEANARIEEGTAQ